MDCQTARLLLKLALPRAQELDQAETAALHAHLVECTACGALAREERRADEHLSAAILAVPVPIGLRARLLARLRAERSARLRGRRLRTAGWVAAAASVLLAVGLFAYTRALPVPNLQEIHAQPLPRRAEDVERRFAELGVTTVAPPQFNYNLLTAWHLVEFEGRKRVPHLLFLRGGEYAEVYILSAKQFDLTATLAQGRIESGGYTVEAHSHPEDARVFYLIKYTGKSLELFLTQDGPPTT